MSTKLSFSIRNPIWLTRLAAPVFLLLFATYLVAQNAPATLPSTKIGDPTKPELQPRLDVDRDPIPSPDPDVVPLAPNAATTAAPAKAGEVQKNQSGMYTLHADVDEVLLNCTVIDDKGRTVTDLHQDAFRIWEDEAFPQSVNSVLHEGTSRYRWASSSTTPAPCAINDRP